MALKALIFGVLFLLITWDQGSWHLIKRAYSIVSLRFTLTTLNFATAAYDQLDRFQDSWEAKWDEQDTFDFIVVGGGSAGSVVANRLSENHQVLLLEAGGEPHPLQQIPILSTMLLNRPGIEWNYLTVPQSKSCLGMYNNQCSWPRAKGLGGCSNHNFLVYMRGHPNDFNNWANVTGDPRWRYENVLQYFKKSEDYSGTWTNGRYHSVGGELKVTQTTYTQGADYFIKAGQEMGLKHTDLNAEFEEGVSMHDCTEHEGRRYGAYSAFIKSARERNNLTIYKYSHVTKVLLESPGNQAHGVEYIRHGVKRIARATKEVIVSAGAINSPQILMLSGIGPREHLESLGIPLKVDLPVGKNLQDHIGAVLGPFTVEAPISIRLERDAVPSEIVKFLLGHKGTALSSSAAQASAFLISKVAKERGQGNWPDIQYILMGAAIPDFPDEIYSQAMNTRHEVLKKYFEKLGQRDSIQVANIVSRPFSRGMITLQGTDPMLPPVIDPNYYADERDMKVAIEGAKRLVAMLENTEAYQAVNATLSPNPFPGCEQLPLRSDAYWECYHRHHSFTIYHPVGTSAMGRRDSKDAVVDSELRVLGTKNLRVIDASVMPFLTTGNTNAPTIMIGEMGANFAKSAWDSNGEGWGRCLDEDVSFVSLLRRDHLTTKLVTKHAPLNIVDSRITT